MRAATRRLVVDDRGAGSALALAVVAAVLVVTAGLMALVIAFAARHQAQSDADASALAAADVASGLVGGVPCEAAARAAGLGGSSLVECALAGGVATVEVGRTVLGAEVRVTSRAGPGPLPAETRPP
ncbi:Rv3654c family TadE-like protein [Subtercola boreus]|uniref:Rv3654c family TadE-like protein n=1 Tax=Subtercola boreus TaxID=120213 RepID=UPI00209BC89C|nr:Rv3654c family TadE-like protein [Subtercola boreus]